MNPEEDETIWRQPLDLGAAFDQVDNVGDAGSLGTREDKLRDIQYTFSFLVKCYPVSLPAQ